MATKFYYLRGVVKWTKARKPDEQYNNYTINLYPDDKSKAMIAESGLQIRPKEDEDGVYYTFRRPHEKLMKGEVVIFGPPTVLNADNTAYDGIVGNGSECTVKVSVYDTMKGKGHRWETVRVEELVEYTPPEGEGNFDMSSMPPPEKKSSPAAAAIAPKGKSSGGARPAIPF